MSYEIEESDEVNDKVVFEKQVNVLLVSIAKEIEKEGKDQDKIVKMLSNKLEDGDVRGVIIEQLVRAIEVKGTKSAKMIKLLDTFGKIKKGSDININVGLNMSPEEKADFINDL